MRISDWSSDVCSSDLEDPFFDLIRQSYLQTSNEMMRLVDTVEGIDPRQKEKLRFATKAFVDAMSPSNFALTKPLDLEKIQETGGENLRRGRKNRIADVDRGTLRNTYGKAITGGVNIEHTPRQTA